MKISITASCVDIALFIVELLMLIVAFCSALYAFKAYRHQKERSKKEVACELAKYYADEILNNATVILTAFSLSGYEEYITGIVAYNDMCDFTKKEFQCLLEKASIDYDQCIKRITEIDPSVLFSCRLSRVYSIKERSEAIKNAVELDENNNVKFPTANYIQNDFMQDVTRLMNQLEWFSMNCQYGIADEELIYQSIHQTFLTTVLLVYPLICQANENNADKHFTNMIWLFTKWRNRLNDITTEAELKREKYLRKAQEIEPEVFAGKCIK